MVWFGYAVFHKSAIRNPKPEIDMVGVAQLVEPQVVALVVVGSSPITHPIKYKMRAAEPARIRFL